MGKVRSASWLLTICTVVVAWLACAGPAAALTWTAQTAPAPEAAEGQLAAISCPSATSCIAVGSDDPQNETGSALAEAWNGQKWSMLTLPGAESFTLTAVSCTSASACTAVGSSPWGEEGCCSGASAVVARWNGHAWSQETFRTPKHNAGVPADDPLTAVSCTSASSCTAVGSFIANPGGVTSPPVPLVGRWNGRSWSVTPLKQIPGRGGSGLTGVECAATSSCLAVGDQATTAFAERYTKHGGWIRMKLAIPRGSDGTGLDAISCPTTGNCTAVGSYGVGTTSRPFVEHWNGHRFSLQATPMPSRAQSSTLAAVACPTRRGPCTVTGADTYPACTTGGPQPCGTTSRLATINGRRSTTLLSAAATTLNGVACLRRTVCTAVGEYTAGLVPATLALGVNGGHIAVQPGAITAFYQAFFDAVSCQGPSACIAVGGDNGDQQAAVAEQATAAGWSLDPFTDPSRGRLDAVACTGPSACLAVGGNPATGAPLNAQWNGTRWTVAAFGPLGSSLSGLACPAANACFAVGYSRGATAPLAESWNGSGWTVQPIPRAPGTDVTSQLNAVACSSPTNCIAVGYSSSGPGLSDVPFAELWNGTSWTISTPAVPTGSTHSLLNGVACPSAMDCIAVGSGSAGPVAEQWNGSSWSLLTVPGGTGAGLQAIACTATTACVAVGFSGALTLTNPLGEPLAESWDGTTWSVQTLPGGAGGTLAGVACASAATCTTVGAATTGTSPLIYTST